ncbi:hypothetical protein LCGC14_0429160 [marine sediment metagenome]|uniref:Uncharacterized protein n=1 Tax=marine sediment metagenome TaxID=412755 RepID=A0A0F9VY43_9ZZZZ
MKGTRILVTSKPRGVFEDVYVVGTPKPGTIMEIEPTTAEVGGLFHYAVYGTQAASSGQYVSNDGDRKAIAILLEYDQQGGIYSRSYVDDELGRIYWPVMGEQFNILVEDVAGTGDDFAIGEEMMVDDGTGKLLTADSNAEAHPFTALEVVTDPTADHWIWCRFNGEGGA